jgi:hypothetical protein
LAAGNETHFIIIGKVSESFLSTNNYWKAGAERKIKDYDYYRIYTHYSGSIPAKRKSRKPHTYS